MSMDKAIIKKIYRETFKFFIKSVDKFHIFSQDLFDSKGKLVPQEVLNFEVNIKKGFYQFLGDFYKKTIVKIDKNMGDSEEDIKHRFMKIAELCDNTINLRLYSIFDVYAKDNNNTRLNQQLKKLYENFFIYLKWIVVKKAKDDVKNKNKMPNLKSLSISKRGKSKYVPKSPDSSDSSDSESESEVYSVDIKNKGGLDYLFSSRKRKSKNKKKSKQSKHKQSKKKATIKK